MSTERCPECGAVGVGCECARGVGFNPLRIRPYVAMPGADQTPPSPQPVFGAMAQPDPDRGGVVGADSGTHPGTDPGTPYPAVPPAAQEPPAPAPTPGFLASVPGARPGDAGTGAGSTGAPMDPPGVPYATEATPWPAYTAGEGPVAQGPDIAPHGHAAGGDEAATAMLPPVPAGPGPVEGTGTPPYGTPVAGPVPPAEQTVQLRAVPLRGPDGRPAERARSRRLPLLAATGAAVAVGAVAVALVLFTGSGEHDAALVDPKPSSPVTESAPAVPSEAPSGPTASHSASAPPSPSASASRSASASASPSASRSASPSPTATRSPSPSAPAKSAKPATLRPGDSGPEVEKLQRLLWEQGLYRGRFDGRYGRGVERAVADFQLENGIYEDDFGVYGPATRSALEG